MTTTAPSPTPSYAATVAVTITRHLDALGWDVDKLASTTGIPLSRLRRHLTAAGPINTNEIVRVAAAFAMLGSALLQEAEAEPRTPASVVLLDVELPPCAHHRDAEHPEIATAERWATDRKVGEVITTVRLEQALAIQDWETTVEQSTGRVRVAWDPAVFVVGFDGPGVDRPLLDLSVEQARDVRAACGPEISDAEAAAIQAQVNELLTPGGAL